MESLTAELALPDHVLLSIGFIHVFFHTRGFALRLFTLVNS